jgi:hypothetical protein
MNWGPIGGGPGSFIGDRSGEPPADLPATDA